MICINCGANIPDGQQYCSTCGVSIDGQSLLEHEIISYNDLKTFIINKKGLYGWNKRKNNPLQPYNNTYFSLVNICPHCGRQVGANEFNCMMCAEPIPIIKSTIKPFKKPQSQRQIIRQQFKRDKTSICPKCGSHNITVYRKGYNWNEAFWGSIFKIRGTRYTAGMDANNAMCKCQNCGLQWNTHYDIRTIK